MSMKSESALSQILGALAMIAIFGFLTWLQIERIEKESYWVIFRIWFIPIPAILLTGLGILGGVVLFFQGISSGFKSLFRR